MGLAGCSGVLNGEGADNTPDTTTSVVPEGSHPVFGVTPTRMGYNPGTSAPEGKPSEQWRFAAGEDLFDYIPASPVMAEERVFFSSDIPKVHAVDTDGKEQWSGEMASGVNDPLTYDDGTVYATAREEPLAAFDAESGKKLWSADVDPVKEDVVGPPVVADGIVAIVSKDDSDAGTAGNEQVRGFDVASGEQRWTYELETPEDLAGLNPQAQAVVDGTLYVVGAHLHAITLADGSRDWVTAPVNARDGLRRLVSVSAVGDTLYTVGQESPPKQAGFRPYHLSAFARSDGSEQWSESLGIRDGTTFYGAMTPAVVDGRVFVGGIDGTLYARSADDGGDLWTYETGDGIQSMPTVVDGTVYVGSKDEKLHAVDAESGKADWTLSVGSPLKIAPCIVDGTIYVLTTSDELIAYA